MNRPTFIPSEEFLRKLPKTDLHVHLDGSIRIDTIVDLAKKQGVALPTTDRDELFKLIYAGDVCESLEDYLKAFNITLSVMQTRDSLVRTAYELCEDAWAEGVRYIEVRYSPILHTHGGLGLADIVEAVLEGLRMNLSFRALAFYDQTYIDFRDRDSATDDFRNYLPNRGSAIDRWRHGVGGGIRLYFRSVVVPLLGFDVGYGLGHDEIITYFAIGLTEL